MANPYDTPKSGAAKRIEVENQVHPPALFLMVLALMTLLLDIPVGYVNFVDAQRFLEIRQMSSAASLGLGTVFVIGMHFVVFIGAYRMYQLSDYRLAKCGAILSVLPILSPGCVLGIPFGIWALRVLSKPEVRQAFAARARTHV